MASEIVPPNPVAKKLQKTLESKIETNKELVNALQTLSTFYTENNLKNRRNLRRDAERRSLEVSQRFTASFRSLKTDIDQVNADIEAMSRCCTDMTQRLQKTKEQTRDLINQTTKLQQESKRVEQRCEIAQTFCKTFQLSKEHIRALQIDTQKNGEAVLGPEFFVALARVKEIYADCKLLLHGTPSTAGLEIMEQLSGQQEKAYELLYRWIQKQSWHINVDTFEMNPLLSEAFRAMQDRPILLRYCIDEFSTARRSNIVRGFIDALTRGGPGDMPKPIELLSHDPLRYVSDMLAWIHQALESEKDHFVALLRLGDQQIVKDHVGTALGQITDGLCRPLRVRVEQVLSGENGPSVLYKLSNVFRFYTNTVNTCIGKESSLASNLDDLREMTRTLFFSSLNRSASKLVEKIEPPSDELKPAATVHQVLLLLRDVLESHDSTLVPAEDKKENYHKIFSCMLDQLIQSLLLSASHLGPLESAVYLLNCLHAMHSLVSLYDYADQFLELLQAQIDAQSDVLVSEQAGYIFQRTGMHQLYTAVSQHVDREGPLSLIADSNAVRASLTKFDLYLVSPESYRLPQCSLLVSNKTRNAVNQRSIAVICSAYDTIYAKVSDPKNQYDAIEKIASKTPQQVADLLGKDRL